VPREFPSSPHPSARFPKRIQSPGLHAALGGCRMSRTHITMIALIAAAGAARAQAPNRAKGSATSPPSVASSLRRSVASQPSDSRTALFDEIWHELSVHDPFFDPDAPEIRKLYDEHRSRIENMPDELDRLREIIRTLSFLKDGHTGLMSRWFLP